MLRRMTPQNFIIREEAFGKPQVSARWMYQCHAGSGLLFWMRFGPASMRNIIFTGTDTLSSCPTVADSLPFLFAEKHIRSKLPFSSVTYVLDVSESNLILLFGVRRRHFDKHAGERATSRRLRARFRTWTHLRRHRMCFALKEARILF